MIDIAKSTCQIEGCDREHNCRGWCRMHYHRWKRHGDPLALAIRNSPAAERFWAKVDKTGPTPSHTPELGACWVWTAQPNEDGYGRFRDAGQLWYAHRWAYHAEHGTLPLAPLEFDHLCRNRACVRLSHLEIVKHRVNVGRGEAGANYSTRTHCGKGHPLSGDNLFVRGDNNGRGCRACRTEAKRRWRQRQVATA